MVEHVNRIPYLVYIIYRTRPVKTNKMRMHICIFFLNLKIKKTTLRIYVSPFYWFLYDKSLYKRSWIFNDSNSLFVRKKHILSKTCSLLGIGLISSVFADDSLVSNDGWSSLILQRTMQHSFGKSSSPGIQTQCRPSKIGSFRERVGSKSSTRPGTRNSKGR